MKDDLARLKAALLAKVPQAPATVREQAISAALEHHGIHRQIASTPDDELANLKSAFRDSVPQAPPSVRNRAISTAREHFSLHTKGNGIDKRHMDKALKPSALNSYVRSLVMQFSRSSLALGGSVALLAIGIVSYQIVVTTYSPLQDSSLQELQSVSETADRAAIVQDASPVSANRVDSHESAAMVQPQTLVMPDSLEKSNIRYYESPYSGSNDDGMLLRSQSRELTMDSDNFHQSDVRFTEFSSNPVQSVIEQPVSTFSIDVDTTAYAYLRAMLRQGVVPAKDAIRTEELVNYFHYDYAPPDTRDQPFATHVSLMPAPWNQRSTIMHIGIKAFEPDRSTAPPANLVFLIDTSGSMDQPNKLPLLIRSFKVLLSNLASDDTVAIVAYAGSAGVVLEPTPVSQRRQILDSLENLHAGGSTAGGEGIRLAYRLAEQHMVSDGVNRVILATDGDFNVGMTDTDELEEFISRKRSSGVFLSVLGFGLDNYNDDLMQHLAQSGNGNAAYIDTISEARKVLAEQLSSTLFTIAKDVKVQVEFNPALVREYRLIGYETRMLDREDFRNDKIDAGEVGVGHAVTAVYELTPANSDAGFIPPSRYQSEEANLNSGFDNEFAFLKIRYKLPDAQSSTLVSQPVTVDNYHQKTDSAPRDVRFAVAVAAFGELLRGGKYTGEFGYEDVITLAKDAIGDDRFGYRSEFIQLVRMAQVASPRK